MSDMFTYDFFDYMTVANLTNIHSTDPPQAPPPPAN